MKEMMKEAISLKIRAKEELLGMNSVVFAGPDKELIKNALKQDIQTLKIQLQELSN